MVEGTSKVLEAFSLIVVSIAAVILNGVTVAVFCNRPALRSPSNRFVLSLIGANFVTVVTLTPVAVANLLMADAPSWLRTISLMLESNAVHASVFSTLSISIDRYNAVLSPLHYTINITCHKSRCLIGFIWLASACLSAPTLCRQKACFLEYEDEFRVFYATLVLLVSFLLPILTLLRVYAKMYAAAHRNSERTRRQSLQASAGDGSRGGSIDSQLPPVVTAADLIRNGKPPMLSQLSKRRCSNASISAMLFREEGRAVKTAVLVVATFIFSWGPFFIYFFIASVKGEMPQPCEYFSILATLLSAILSPFLYVYRNEIARSEGLRLLFWWRQRGLYRGNVLQQVCKDIDVKAIDAMRLRHQMSSNCDTMSIQSFNLPAPFSPDCKECAEIPQPPVADFVSTYEVVEENKQPVIEPKPKVRGESVTFKLATLPQRKCGVCSRQNSDSSSGSGYPLLRDTDSPITGTGGRRYDRYEQLSRGSSFDDSPTFRGSPRLPPSYELVEPRSQGNVIFQFSNIIREVPGDSIEVTLEEGQQTEKCNPPQRQDSGGTVDSGVEIDRSLSSSSSLSATSPMAPKVKRHIHKLQRLAAVEDEDSPTLSRSYVAKHFPCDFG